MVIGYMNRRCDFDFVLEETKYLWDLFLAARLPNVHAQQLRMP
jgi:hypothetical protein